MSDWQLLRQYVDEGSDAAFTQLVDRHKKLVYWTCRRDIEDVQHAEDAAQAVFITLARRAATIRKDASLAGWLFTVARHVSKRVRDSEQRRRRNEERAALHMQSEVNTDAAWEQVEPWLNDALASLSGQDRGVVLLRFCEGYSFPEIAGTLGTTEEAARKRVARSLERLRLYLGRKDVSVATAVLATLLAERAANAVPDTCTIISGKAILAAASTGAAHVANAHTGSLLIKKGATILMDTTIKKAAITGGIILLLGGGIAVTVVKHHAQASQAASASFGQRTLYTVTDLGTLPGFIGSGAADINNKGEIVGGVFDDKGARQPFYYRDGAMHGIAMPPDYSGGFVNHINDQGMMIGNGNRQMGGAAKPDCLLGSKDGLTVYTPPVPMKWSRLTAINDKGVILGYYLGLDGAGPDDATPFILSDGNFSPIPTTAGLANVYGINNNGDIVGNMKRVRGFARACIYSQGKTTLLPIPAGYQQSGALAINDRGDVTGTLETGTPRNITGARAYLYHNGSMTDLGTVDGFSMSFGHAINAAGVVVGYCNNMGEERHAAIFKSSRAIDLNTLIDPASGWQLSGAFAINDSGWIVGEGVHNGAKRAFLLKPKS